MDVALRDVAYWWVWIVSPLWLDLVMSKIPSNINSSKIPNPNKVNLIIHLTSFPEVSKTRLDGTLRNLV